MLAYLGIGERYQRRFNLSHIKHCIYPNEQPSTLFVTFISVIHYISWFPTTNFYQPQNSLDFPLEAFKAI